jgi:lactoylglutathione lyase
MDVGLYTNALEPMLAFWRGEAGARFEGLNPMAPGRMQHRHDLNRSVLKINHYEEPLAEAAPSGYAEVLVARPGIGEPRRLTDPDGNPVTLVPPGRFGVEAVGVRVRANDPDAHGRFYVDALGMTPIDGGRGGYRLGESVVLVEEARERVVEAPMSARGYRYLTLAVVDCREAHAFALAGGAREGAPVRGFRDGIFFSLLRDPDGNWIELAQRP